MSSEECPRKIVHMPGTRLSPEVALHRTLDRIADIDGIVIVARWKDDTVSCDWSQNKSSDLCFMLKVLDAQVTRVVMNGEEE